MIHDKWNDNNMFIKKLVDNSIVQDEGQTNSFKITCNKVNTSYNLLEYDINPNVVDPGAVFKVTGSHSNDQYKLEIKCKLNSNNYEQMKNSQMKIIIMTKSSSINIVKATSDKYVIEDKKITYNLNSFNTVDKFMIGLLFDTKETDFVEVVKVFYRYMVNNIINDLYIYRM
jgi:hypothetical protein